MSAPGSNEGAVLKIPHQGPEVIKSIHFSFPFGNGFSSAVLAFLKELDGVILDPTLGVDED
jgi:hypothetical protein